MPHMDPTLSAAIVGLIIACTGFLGVLAQRLAVHTKQGNKAIATNHGKRPGEYLEMVAEVQTDVQTLTAKVDKVITLIADHTVQDSTNFAELRALFTASDVAAATETKAAARGRASARKAARSTEA